MFTANNPSLGRLVKTHTHTQVTLACNKLEAAKAEVTLPFKTMFLMLTEQAGKVFERSNKTARNAKLYVCLRVQTLWGVASIGQSGGLLSRWLWVRVPPPQLMILREIWVRILGFQLKKSKNSTLRHNCRCANNRISPMRRSKSEAGSTNRSNMEQDWISKKKEYVV